MFERKITLCTWNVCLGLGGKLLEVKNLLYRNKIDVLVLQEVEIQGEIKVFDIPGYDLEVEEYSTKARVCMYIKKDIPFTRKVELESRDRNVIAIEVLLNPKVKVIGIYRPFKLKELENLRESFTKQIDIIRKLITNVTSI